MKSSNFTFILLGYFLISCQTVTRQPAQQSQSGPTCVPPVEYFPFQGAWVKPESNGLVATGSYSRVSPDGNYVLRSLSGSFLSTVTLMKLPPVGSAETVKAIETPLTNESFPMMGTWRFLASPEGFYYRFKDIAQKGRQAQPQFKAGISGFYATAAEMSATEDGIIKFRSLSWPQGNSDNGTMGSGQLQNKVTVIKKSKNGSYSVISETRAVYMCDNLKGSEGTLFTLPMISQDGTEFSALPVSPSDHKQSMRIYKVGKNQADCKKVDNLGYAGAKMIFGFSSSGNDEAPVVFRGGASADSTGSGVYLFDRKIKGTFEVNGLPYYAQAEDFPGMAKDGRVIFASRWRECTDKKKCPLKAGYVRVDPYQSPNFVKFREALPDKASHFKSCITIDDVQKSAAEFKMTADGN